MIWFSFCWPCDRYVAYLVAQRLKHLPAMPETWVQFLGWEDPLEREMATHSSILAWRIPQMSPGGHKELDVTKVLNFHFHFSDG